MGLEDFPSLEAHVNRLEGFSFNLKNKKGKEEGFYEAEDTLLGHEVECEDTNSRNDPPFEKAALKELSGVGPGRFSDIDRA